MSPRTKQIVPALLATAVGVGFIYVVAKYRRNIIRQLSGNPLRFKTIEIVNDHDSCVKIANTLRSHCSEYKVLGFDCEWVTLKGSRHPIALLQLASHRGLCALIRLCRISQIPKELRELLADDEILKVGVAPIEDGLTLAVDYGITVGGTLDLRHLSVMMGGKPDGLARMSQALLNQTLDKHWKISCSNWEAEELSEKQVEYAANDAMVAIEIFKIFERRIRPRYFWENKDKVWSDVMDTCQRYCDIKFKAGMAPLERKKKNKLLSNGTNLKEQPLKSFERHISTRSRPLYDNYLLQAPDGELLCTCDKKKATWYLQNNLGQLVSEDPFTVRLNFEPAGRAVGDVGKYYTIEKVNRCVVCGRDDAYIRKNVIPREYRKNFPLVMKSHTSHDVLLLCPQCHQISNIADQRLRNKLAELCDAPVPSDNQKFVEVPRLKKLRSAARALLKNPEKIPEERRNELSELVLAEYPGGTELNQEVLNEISNVEIMESVESYCAHGETVVSHFQDKLGGLIELERMWRQNFLDTMRPKFLPELWSVNHNVNRLEIRATEGRVNITDLMIAGLDPELVEIDANKTIK